MWPFVRAVFVHCVTHSILLTLTALDVLYISTVICVVSLHRVVDTCNHNDSASDHTEEKNVFRTWIMRRKRGTLTFCRRLLRMNAQHLLDIWDGQYPKTAPGVIVKIANFGHNRLKEGISRGALNRTWCQTMPSQRGLGKKNMNIKYLYCPNFMMLMERFCA